MNKLILIGTIIIVIASCRNRNEKNVSLENSLEIISQFQTVSYNSAAYVLYPGDTVPIRDKRLQYVEEYSFPSDTSVGACFVRFKRNDTSKMDYAYDSKIRARIDWEKYHYETDDFSKNRWPYRVVMPPFFVRAKAIIEYTLSTSDSITIDTIDYENSLAYKISIHNENVEFVGKLPIHINELGSNEGLISEYILWINKETLLPFKFQRTIEDNIMVEDVHDVKSNTLNNDDFSIANYIPQDMPRKSKSAKSPDVDLVNTTAQNVELKDLENKIHFLNDAPSKVYMINFTSAYCGACKKSIPYLNELDQKYSDTDFDFVSLYAEYEQSTLKRYMDKNKIKYNVLFCDKQVEKAFQVGLFPTFMILDSDKRIRKILHGYKKGITDIEIEKTIEELL